VHRFLAIRSMSDWGHTGDAGATTYLDNIYNVVTIFAIHNFALPLTFFGYMEYTNMMKGRYGTIIIDGEHTRSNSDKK